MIDKQDLEAMQALYTQALDIAQKSIPADIAFKLTQDVLTSNRHIEVAFDDEDFNRSFHLPEIEDPTAEKVAEAIVHLYKTEYRRSNKTLDFFGNDKQEEMSTQDILRSLDRIVEEVMAIKKFLRR